LALTKAEVKKLRVAVASAEEVTERARTAAAATETAARDTAQAAAREKATLEARVLELECDLGAPPRRTWRRPAASSLRSPTSFRWFPRRRHGYVTTTPSCRMTLKVSRVVAFFLYFARCSFLVTF
jgi:hypothetical protein